MQALINFNIKINAINLEYILKLYLKVCFINVKTQKINGFNVKMFEMILANFQVENKLIKIGFFKSRFY